MAIVIDEAQRKPTHIFAILSWLGFLVVVSVAVYYIFFATPQAAILPTTGGLSAIAPLANSAVQPQDVISSAAFQAILHGTTIQPPSPSGPATKGRSNPFLAP